MMTTNATRDAAVKIKCRKCRLFLLKTSCLLSSHGDPLSEANNHSCPGITETTMWFIDLDAAPQWMTDCVDKGCWQSGKIDCPSCNGRLGSFNFLQARYCPCKEYLNPSVWLMKSRVDVCFHQKVDKERPKQQAIDNTWKVVDHDTEAFLHPTSSSSINNVGMSHPSDSEILQVLPTKTSQDYRSMHKWKKLQCQYVRKEKLLAKEQICFETKSMQDKYACSVCYELYYLPTNCFPCCHIFCDPCIRAWNRQSGNPVTCPVCRCIVTDTSLVHEMIANMRRLFPLSYNIQKKKYAKRPFHPLPKKNRSDVLEERNLSKGTQMCLVMLSVLLYAVVCKML